MVVSMMSGRDPARPPFPRHLLEESNPKPAGLGLNVRALRIARGLDPPAFERHPVSGSQPLHETEFPVPLRRPKAMVDVRNHEPQPVLRLQPAQDVEQADRIESAADPNDHGVTADDHVVPEQRPPDQLQDVLVVSPLANGHGGSPP